MRSTKPFFPRSFSLLAAVSAAVMLSCASGCAVSAGEMSAEAAEDLTAEASGELTEDAAGNPAGAMAEEMIVENSTESEAAGPETETEAGPLMETETVYEIPLSVMDGLKKNTPDGEVFRMKGSERSALLADIYQANSAQKIWKWHDDVSATCSLFDQDAQTWKEYSTYYADPLIYYSDDWTPGLEELRLLIYGKDACVEDYAYSQRFVCFLNASGTPYRDYKTDPVTLDDDTLDEMLLRIHRTEDALYVITQLTESSILRLSLDEPEGEDFYSCLYLLDPDTLEVRSVRIALHELARGKDDRYNVRDMQNISYSYDHGMSHIVETGYMGLVRHMEPGAAWPPEDLREVRVTLDPGTDEERVVLLTTLKGDPVSYSLPEGYELYRDEALTVRWVDNGDYTSDLSLWAGPASE